MSREPSAERLPLEKLDIKVAELQTDLRFVTSVLRRCPQFTSLRLAGIRLPSGSSLSQLFTTLSGICATAVYGVHDGVRRTELPPSVESAGNSP